MPRRLFNLFGLIVVGLVVVAVSAANGTTRAEEVPAGWTYLSLGNEVSIAAPPGTKFRETKGTDSLVGVLEGPGFMLHTDYGLYSNPLLNSGTDNPRTIQNVVVDGRPATLFIGTGPLGGSKFIGLHVPEIRETFLGKIRLTIAGQLTEPKTLETVRKMFMTIHFK